MKNLISFVILAILAGFGLIQENVPSSKVFYYAYDERIYLSEASDKVIVQFARNKNSESGVFLSDFANLKEGDIIWRDDSTAILKINQSEKLKFQSVLSKREDVLLVNPIFKTAEGLDVAYTDRFIIELKDKGSLKALQRLNEENKVEILELTDHLILLRASSGDDALALANKYYESGITKYSHPDFFIDFVSYQFPNDPYFNNQFYLHNTGQVIADGRSGTADADIDAPEAWNVTVGSPSIIVAVLDAGVTSNHVDLPNTRQVRLNGSNFGNGDANDPSPTGDNNHGNACAGIIAATRNNNIGISGVASGVRVMPIRIQNSNLTFVSTAQIANAFDFARTNGAHVISNSWGTTTEVGPNAFPAIRDAIFRAATLGRNGLGCVVVFAAGNEANHTIGNPAFIGFPANVTVPGVLSVGASDRNDLQANYSPTSNTGSPNNQIIDIVAPSHRAFSWQIAGETGEVYTIDIPGTPGYNPVKSTDGGLLPLVGSVLPNTGPQHLDFTARFGGTSAACPQVAAAAALILSVRPQLTQMEVFNILTRTADKVGGYVYNSVGTSNELGFGRLNVCRALTSTSAVISGPSSTCSSAQFSFGGTLPPGSFVSSWVSSNPSGFVINNATGVGTRINNYNGPITVTANISNGCGISQSNASHTIWVGTPHITNMRVNNQPVLPSQSISLCPGNHWLNVTPVGGNAGTATWTVPSGVPHWIGNNTIDFTFPSNMSSIAISVRSSNSCGQGANYNFFLSRQNWNCPSSFAMVAYPNPTSDELNIEMTPMTAEASREEAPIIESAILLNADGREVAKGIREGSKIVFDVRQLKKGTYFIHVLVGGELRKEQIVIE